MTTVSAPARTQWTLDPTHTSVEFSVRHMMITSVKGRFTDVQGSVVLDEARPEESQVEVTMAAASIDTRQPQRDEHLRSADFFDAATFPTLTFRSRSVQRDGDDLTLVTWGNGLLLSFRVVQRLLDRGIRTRVVDLRWLAPLPLADVLREARATGRTLVVDETRRSGGVGEGIVAELVDAGYTGALGRVSSKDSFVPLGDAARLVLLSEDEIEQAALRLLE